MISELFLKKSVYEIKFRKFRRGISIDKMSVPVLKKKQSHEENFIRDKLRDIYDWMRVCRVILHTLFLFRFFY